MMNWMRRKWKSSSLLSKDFCGTCGDTDRLSFLQQHFCPFFIPECPSHGFVLGRNQFFFRGAGICRCFCLHCYCTDALLDFYHSCAGIHIIGQAAVHVILLYMVHQFVRQAMEAFHFHRLVRGKKILDMKGIPCRDEVNFTYTEDEIRCIVEESHRGGRLNTLENTLIKNSFDFFDLDVRDVMIPRNDMVVLDFNDDMDVMRRNISKTHHTCYPVCMEDKDHILGFIHVKDFLESLLRGEYNIKRIMREILTVPEVMPAPALLQMMKNKRTYLAVVVDEYGGTSGLVTLEDLMEELAGEIPQNESNAPAEILRVNDHVYEFDGTVILEDVSERLQMEFDDEERNNTIGGLIFSKLERIPQVGDHISFGGWKFTVLKMYGFRIMRVKAEMDRKEETEPDSHE